MTREAWKAQFESVVFLSDRQGAALDRRTRCLELVSIPYTVQVELRASGKYYKLCVRAADAVDAHLALQMGGCPKGARLQPLSSPGLLAGLRDVATTLWDEVVLLVHRGIDYVWSRTPTLLVSSSRSDPEPDLETKNAEPSGIAAEAKSEAPSDASLSARETEGLPMPFVSPSLANDYASPNRQSGAP